MMGDMQDPGSAPSMMMVGPAVAIEMETKLLDESNTRRLAEINARGRMVSGIDTNLVESMLEMLLTPEAMAVARLNHQRWLATTLDEIESNLRKQAITAPLQGV